MDEPDETARHSLRRRTTCVLATTALIAAGGFSLADSASAATAAGGTVYVSSSGGVDDMGCGTSLQNQCETIQYGIGQASAGETVQVAAGTYNEVVDIEKAITLQGAGAGKTIIDGTGKDQTSSSQFGQKYGVVYIGATGGDATVSGFTIENPYTFAGDSGDPISVVVQDPDAGDSATISDNTILGNASNTDPTAGQIGVYSFHNAADLAITDNDISGVFQGVLLEAVAGSSDISGNTIHGLQTATYGSDVYAGEGVFLLSDSGTTMSGQSITGNTFSGYGGIGIAMSAGYDNGNCTASPCNGNIDATAVQNHFTLGANAGNQTAAAFRLAAVDGGNLALTSGSNSGTVVAGTQPITESADSTSSITVTPTATPNTIVTNPAPTASVSAPATVTTGEAAQSFDGTATNPSGEDLPNVRYDLRITGTSGLTASQLNLQYSVNGGTTYQPVPLSGTASTGNAITGYFGPQSGFTLPNGANNTTKFKMSVPTGAPAGTLTSTVSLDQVDTGGSHPAINTLASTTSTTQIVQNTPPMAKDLAVSTTLDTPVAITLQAPDANGDPVTYATTTTPANGTLSGTAPNLTFTPATGFIGSTSFAYTASDGISGSTSATVTIVVNSSPTSLSASLTPAAVTTADQARLAVAVSAPKGSVDGGTVTVFGSGADGSAFGLRATVSGGTASFTLPKLAAGNTVLDIMFSGTSTTSGQQVDLTVPVSKVTPRISVATDPSTLKSSQTKTGHIVVTFIATGANPDGGQARLYFGSSKISQANVSGGKVTFGIYRTLSPGQHLFQVRYAGTSTVNSLIQNFRITVTKG